MPELMVDFITSLVLTGPLDPGRADADADAMFG
jgi:hypothetical protein